MKTKFAFIIFFELLSLAGMAQQSIDKEIRNLEQREVTAFLNQDYKTLDKLWDSNLTVNSAKNIIEHNAQEIKNLLKAGLIRNAEMERNIEEVLIYENMVITMGNEVIKSMEGKIVRRRFTNIWLKSRKGWKFTASQHSIICE